MEEKKLTDQESLELISQMIRSTRENMEVGRGNLFLYFGYFSAFLGIAIYILTALTSNGVWGFGWFLMFAFWGLLYYFSKKPAVVTYTDRAIRTVWKVIGYMFIISCLSIVLIGWFAGQINFSVMMPLSLIYMGMGTSMTGVIIRNKTTVYLPLLAMVIPFYMFVMMQNGNPPCWWELLFSLAAIIIMVIPGHVLNAKSRS